MHGRQWPHVLLVVSRFKRIYILQYILHTIPPPRSSFSALSQGVPSRMRYPSVPCPPRSLCLGVPDRLSWSTMVLDRQINIIASFISLCFSSPLLRLSLSLSLSLSLCVCVCVCACASFVPLLLLSSAPLAPILHYEIARRLNRVT